MVRLKLLFVATLLAASFLVSCGGSGTPLLLPGGIVVEAAAPSLNIEDDLASLRSNECVTSCDGALDDEEIRVPIGSDLRGFLRLLYWDWLSLSESDITATQIYMDTIAGIPGGETRDLTFIITRTTNCNSTSGSDGDTSKGTVVERFSWSSTFNNSGEVAGTTSGHVIRTTFNNCLIMGDILNNGAPDEAIRLSGSWTFENGEPLTPMPLDPLWSEGSGRVLVWTDADANGTFGNEFWNKVFNLDAAYLYDGSLTYATGGGCAGEAVFQDADPATDTGDGCAADTDGVTDGFESASLLIGP